MVGVAIFIPIGVIQLIGVDWNGHVGKDGTRNVGYQEESKGNTRQ